MFGGTQTFKANKRIPYVACYKGVVIIYLKGGLEIFFRISTLK